MSNPFDSSEIEIPITTTFNVSDVTYFSQREITPNAKQSVNANFTDGTSATVTRNIPDFTFADVTATAGVQMIVITSNVDIKVKFRDSGNNIIVGDSTNGIELEAGQTQVSVRDDSNTSIPFNFTIPNSGTCTNIFLDKGATANAGSVEVSVYYNVGT